MSFICMRCRSLMFQRSSILQNVGAIYRLTMIDHKGDVLHANQAENTELFRARRGGSPGNFGVITHFTISAFKSKSYMGIENTIKNSKGTEIIHRQHAVKTLKNDEEWRELQKAISNLPQPVQDLLDGKLPHSIVLYSQWCPIGDQQKYDERVDAWFNRWNLRRHG
ncbi:unnamed protein product [Fusarium venenatum]|uniref:Uncharacterized protein n=1 Tax=Fusarium venenatum TaxID=56646 RepID=A0A2L2TPB9_9HYPO|nr:uncharacterized protein FVRRES_04163 [Fusarium venenatum]CEI67651.1 unnamed protein product [Fusarium venenatum]